MRHLVSARLPCTGTTEPGKAGSACLFGDCRMGSVAEGQNEAHANSAQSEGRD